ncbi:hypothetical protein ASE93_23205 [Serratia sp. Leaf50]|nr:hypothetical protein ASE93_23205 [Serratia sp. Leaf50]
MDCQVINIFFHKVICELLVISAVRIEPGAGRKKPQIDSSVLLQMKQSGQKGIFSGRKECYKGSHTVTGFLPLRHK